MVEKWTEKIFEVQHVSDRIIFHVVSVDASQIRHDEAERETESLKTTSYSVAVKILANEVLIPGFDDWSVHVGFEEATVVMVLAPKMLQ